ncbi:MAG: hypothetical protein LKJ88_03705 [Bacilli bacterium]|jgi:hypothetical protein|nr:hypothetical protein [Bacilli bacterium]
MKKRKMAVLVFILLLVSCNHQETSSLTSSSFSTSSLSSLKQEGDNLVIYYPSSANFRNIFEKTSPLFKEDQGNGAILLNNGLQSSFRSISDEDSYYSTIDGILSSNASLSSNDKIDMFLVSENYLLKYMASGYAVNLLNLGFQETNFASQYSFARQEAISSKNEYLASGFQLNPGLFAYRRDLAQTIFGTSSPEDIQAKVASWDDFTAAAQTVEDKGYLMLSGFGDSLDPFLDGISAPLVSADKVNFDDSLENWVTQTKDFTSNGFNNSTEYESTNWILDQGPSSQVFSFFLSSSQSANLVINSLSNLDGEQKLGNGLYGQWGLCQGPSLYRRDNMYLLAATGGDNNSAVKEIIREMTMDSKIMKSIASMFRLAVNNEAVMDSFTANDVNPMYQQSDLALYAEVNKKSKVRKGTIYDARIRDLLLHNSGFKNYFLGKITEEEAKTKFYNALKQTYPSLTVPS